MMEETAQSTNVDLEILSKLTVAAKPAKNTPTQMPLRDNAFTILALSSKTTFLTLKEDALSALTILIQMPTEINVFRLSALSTRELCQMVSANLAQLTQDLMSPEDNAPEILAIQSAKSLIMKDIAQHALNSPDQVLMASNAFQINVKKMIFFKKTEPAKPAMTTITQMPLAEIALEKHALWLEISGHQEDSARPAKITPDQIQRTTHVLPMNAKLVDNSSEPTELAKLAQMAMKLMKLKMAASNGFLFQTKDQFQSLKQR